MDTTMHVRRRIHLSIAIATGVVFALGPVLFQALPAPALQWLTPNAQSAGEDTSFALQRMCRASSRFVECPPQSAQVRSAALFA